MKPWKRDALLILALLLFSAVLWLFLRPGEDGSTLVVTIRGEEYARYSLLEDRTVKLGEDEYNILVISGGEAWIRDANCGDHTCIRIGKISQEGEQIICLPHTLIVEVVGGEDSGIDASTH